MKYLVLRPYQISDLTRKQRTCVRSVKPKHIVKTIIKSQQKLCKNQIKLILCFILLENLGIKLIVSVLFRHEIVSIHILSIPNNITYIGLTKY